MNSSSSKKDKSCESSQLACLIHFFIVAFSSNILFFSLGWLLGLDLNTSCSEAKLLVFGLVTLGLRPGPYQGLNITNQ